MVCAYTTPTTSNRLAATAGPLPIRSFSYDQAGNITTDRRIVWTYNARGRMVSASTGSATTTYTYDGLGQRVKKSGPASTTYFVYDEHARLLGEYDASGNVIQEYVYLAGELLAILKGTTDQPEVFYVYTDPVGRAWTVTDTGNRSRWRWDPPPFGEALPDDNPSGLGAFVLNWRGTWGYADKESGLNYLTHRDLDPGTGRFVQVDPLGLADGTNPYLYPANPLSFVDPLGLYRNPWDIYNDAMQDAYQSGLPGPWNGQQDAYRHCLASCMMAQENGSSLAKAFGWANEKKGDWFHNQEIGERQMDDHNNACGFGYGASAKNKQDCKNSCLGAATSGGLKTYPTGMTPGYWY